MHLAWHDDAEASYAAVRAALGPNAIVGVDAGHSRHDAMSLGESGADYVAFSLPRQAADRVTAEQQHFDLIEWWAEIFSRSRSSRWTLKAQSRQSRLPMPAP